MNFLSPQFLMSIGIDIDASKQAKLSEHFESTLNERVGLAVMDACNDNKAEQLVKLTNTGSDKEISDWIAKNVPEYKQIIQDEYDILLNELASSSKDI
jgi:hypothetical protein